MATASAQILHQLHTPGDNFISKSITISNAGSVIAVTGLLAASNSSNAVTGVSDPTNGTYTLAKEKSNVILGGNVDNTIYYFENAAIGTYTVTVSFGGTQVDAALLIIEEITGSKTSGSLNQTNSGESTGSTSPDAVTAGNITATTGDFVLASTISHRNSGVSHGTGYTDSYNATTQFATEHIANSSSGTVAGSFTTTDSAGVFESCVVSFFVGTTTAYTLTASGGSFGVTGTAAGLKVGRKVPANSGNYVISGSSVVLRAARKLSMGSGAYVISGTAAGLDKGFTLSATPGSYSISGTPATLRVARKLSVSSGTYTFSGSDARLDKGFTLAANSGIFSISTPSTALRKAKRLAADTTSYDISSNGVTFTYSAAPVIPVDTSDPADDLHFENYIRRYANDRDILNAIEDNLSEEPFIDI